MYDLQTTEDPETGADVSLKFRDLGATVPSAEQFKFLTSSLYPAGQLVPAYRFTKFFISFTKIMLTHRHTI